MNDQKPKVAALFIRFEPQFVAFKTNRSKNFFQKNIIFDLLD